MNNLLNWPINMTITLTRN